MSRRAAACGTAISKELWCRGCHQSQSSLEAIPRYTMNEMLEPSITPLVSNQVVSRHDLPISTDSHALSRINVLRHSGSAVRISWEQSRRSYRLSNIYIVVWLNQLTLEPLDMMQNYWYYTSTALRYSRDELLYNLWNISPSWEARKGIRSVKEGLIGHALKSAQNGRIRLF